MPQSVVHRNGGAPDRPEADNWTACGWQRLPAFRRARNAHREWLGPRPWF